MRVTHFRAGTLEPCLPSRSSAPHYRILAMNNLTGRSRGAILLPNDLMAEIELLRSRL